MSNTVLEEGQALLPDIPDLSEHLRPLRINNTILYTPPIALSAFGPTNSQAGYDSKEGTNASKFLSSLHTHLMDIFAQRIREALKSNRPYSIIKDFNNKLYYSIFHSLFLAQTTNENENLYILVSPLEKGVSL